MSVCYLISLYVIDSDSTLYFVICDGKGKGQSHTTTTRHPAPYARHKCHHDDVLWLKPLYLEDGTRVKCVRSIIAMSGLTTRASHQSEYGRQSLNIAQFVDRVQRELTNLISDLHDMGFHWENLVLLVLSLNFGYGHTYDSTISVEVLTPLTHPVATDGFDFSSRITLAIETMKREFMVLCDFLRRVNYIPKTSVATMSMNMTLSCLHKYRISLESRGSETLHRFFSSVPAYLPTGLGLFPFNIRNYSNQRQPHGFSIV